MGDEALIFFSGFRAERVNLLICLNSKRNGIRLFGRFVILVIYIALC